MTLVGGPLSTPGGRSERSFTGRTSRGHQSLTFATLPSSWAASPSGVPSAGGCCPRRPHSQGPAHRGCAGCPAGWLLGPLEDARLRKERGCPRPHPPSQAGPLEPRFPGEAAEQGAGSPTFWSHLQEILTLWLQSQTWARRPWGWRPVPEGMLGAGGSRGSRSCGESRQVGLWGARPPLPTEAQTSHSLPSAAVGDLTQAARGGVPSVASRS